MNISDKSWQKAPNDGIIITHWDSQSCHNYPALPEEVCLRLKRKKVLSEHESLGYSDVRGLDKWLGKMIIIHYNPSINPS